METKTAWQSVQLPRFPKVSADGRYDVIVIGGGITGLTTAYLLKRAGKKVCLLERQQLAGGDTGCTTAHLTCVTDLRLSEMARRFGKDAARLAWQGGAAAMPQFALLGHCGIRR
jgi:glycine/D-amino acid oxidase-like deaminating enzyme